MSIAVVQTECNHGDIDDRCAGMCGERTSPGRASLDAGAAVTGVVLPETSVVGMIGVGDMGGAIVRSILRAGYSLVVYDVRPEAAGEFVALAARRPVRRCWRLLEAFGGDLFHLGPAGAGMAGKLVNNMLALGSNILQLEAMQLARAYGIGENDATRFIAVGTGDAQGVRTWGRYDRWRRGHRLFGTPGFYNEYSKDMRYAAIAAGERKVTLPLAAGIGAMIPAKMWQRDEYLDAAGWDAGRPRCGICGLELSVAYHEAGVHPECRDLRPRR